MHLKTITVFSVILLATTPVRCGQIRAAPYFMPLDNNPPDVSQAIKASGIKEFILAFVLAPNSGGCVPTWDGNIKQKVSDDTKVLKIIETIRSAGGDVSVAFGGYGGVELANSKACSSVEKLAEAYQTVIDKYNLTHIDLDIEGDELGEDESERKRLKAVKILKEKAKSKGEELFVSLAMPSTSVGLSDLSMGEVRKAVEEGVVIDLYKVMAFDYGGVKAEQEASVMRLMELAHQQIKLTRKDLSDKQVYAATGLVIMNGHSDQRTEYYDLGTLEKLIAYSHDKQLGRLSFLSLNRDRPCSKSQEEWVSGVCSSIEQMDFDFSKLLSTFQTGKDQTTQTVEPTTVESNKTDETTVHSNETTVHSNETTIHSNETTIHSNETTVETSVTTEGNTSTTAYISTSRVTFSPIIDNVDCRKAPDNAHFPYKNDCTEYIRCYNKLAHLEVCPKGTIYDTKLHLCNWPQAVDRPECK